MDVVGGFWIFMAAILVAGMWQESRAKAEKHETLRRIVEKTGTIDEAKLKELFSAAPDEAAKPGYGYRFLRVAGAIVLSVSAAMATFLVIAVILGKAFGMTGMFDNITALIAIVAISGGVAILGLGLFFSSRFCDPPAG